MIYVVRVGELAGDGYFGIEADISTATITRTVRITLFKAECRQSGSLSETRERFDQAMLANHVPSVLRMIAKLSSLQYSDSTCEAH